MANEPVRPRIMSFLKSQGGYVHVGGIARGAQVSAPSVRMVLGELGAAGRLEVRGPGDMPGPTGAGYRLRLDDAERPPQADDARLETAERPGGRGPGL